MFVEVAPVLSSDAGKSLCFGKGNAPTPTEDLPVGQETLPSIAFIDEAGMLGAKLVPLLVEARVMRAKGDVG